MYNILRKGLIAVAAGLLLLLLYTCRTTSDSSGEDNIRAGKSMEQFFPGYRDVIVFIKNSENQSLMESITASFELKGAAESTFKKSSEIYIATGLDAVDGYDIILKGEFSRFTMELGLFFSFSWKKVTVEGHDIWKSKDGINLSFYDNSTIVISTTEMSEILYNLDEYSIDHPDNSLYLTLPSLDADSVRKLSSGFIKGGVESLSIALDSEDADYNLEAEIGVRKGKAKAFSRLINIFLKLALAGSTDPDMIKVGEEYEVVSENSTVLINNIVLNQKKVIELLNNLLVIKGEADK